MTTLVIECEGAASTRVELPPGEYALGSDPASAIVIGHPTVSGHHCDLLVQSDGQVILRDAGSTNGTWVDGEPLSQVRLAAGRSFRAGVATITLERARPVPLPPRLPAAVPCPTAAPPSVAPVGSTLPRTFFQELPRACLYPFRGEAYVCIVIVLAMGLLEAILPDFFGILGLLIHLVIGCYLLLLWQQIVHSTIDGADRFPDFPNVSLDWRENFTLYLRYVALAWICFSPVFLYYYSKMWDLSLPGWSIYPCYGFACLYFPMALLGFLITDSFGVLSPVFIIRSILRKLPDYLLLAGLFTLFIGGAHLFSLVWSGGAGERPRPRTLIVATSILATPVSLYCLFVWTRLLGLFYRHHKDRLAWV